MGSGSKGYNDRSQMQPCNLIERCQFVYAQCFNERCGFYYRILLNVPEEETIKELQMTDSEVYLVKLKTKKYGTTFRQESHFLKYKP